MEDHLIAWFAAHPFWKNEAVLILGALAALARKDWESFKAHQVGDPTAIFSWTVAAREYSKAIIIAGVPPLFAEVWHILGAVPQ